MREYFFGLGVVWFLVYVIEPISIESSILKLLITIIGSIFAYFLMVILEVIPPKYLGDFVYYRQAGKMGSLANLRGNKERIWTPAGRLMRWSKMNTKKNHLNIDNFVFTYPVLHQLSIFGLKGLYQNKPINIPIAGSNRAGTDAVEGILILGSAGGGKSQFLLNVFTQEKFNRAIVHDAKGEFIKYFYQSNKDLIVNPFDKRGAVWDIWEEAKHNIVAIELFFDTYIQNFMNKDFWSNSAVLEYKNVFESVNEMELTSLEKWKIYNEEISNLIKEYSDSESRAKNSLALVMKMIQKHFLEQEKLIENGAKTFTLNDFIKTNDTRLFLSNRAEYSSVLKPFYTAFLSVLTVVLASKEDTKEDITLLMLDEYLTFANNMLEETLVTLHTTLRSRGVMIVTAMQSLPTDSERKALVWSNNRYFIIYPTIDTNTQKTIKELIGKVNYLSKGENYSTRGRVSESKSYSSNSNDGISEYLLTTISNINYGHITVAPTPNILYIGKNKLFKKEAITKPFVKA